MLSSTGRRGRTRPAAGAVSLEHGLQFNHMMLERLLRRP